MHHPSRIPPSLLHLPLDYPKLINTHHAHPLLQPFPENTAPAFYEPARSNHGLSLADRSPHSERENERYPKDQDPHPHLAAHQEPRAARLPPSPHIPQFAPPSGTYSPDNAASE